MPLTSGAKLGPYEILSPLGAGGMGEVYRAKDTKLGRDVAVKILPAAVAKDPDRLARFEREAKVLASLNHPNIAQIYGLEDRALVMELVEGPTLAERVKSSPLPVDEALPIARQMAEGLEYAHERGIVHRDLKPANLKVTPDAVVKVLDFGLAKAFNAQGSAFNLKPNDSPTLSIASTQAGVILGTAAYMSPEQAKGKSVDRRADIWAFGCVLFEMLTGKQAFKGETVSDVLAAVIMKDPDWSALPSDMPAAIKRLIRRCLVKDPRQRVQSIGDARIAIEEVLSDSPQDASSFVAIAASRIPAPAWRRALPWSIAALAVVAAVFATLVFRPRTNPAATMRFTLAPPAEGEFAADLGAAAVLSPDGSRLAYCLRTGEKIQMYVRELSQAQATLLPGTDGAQNPFFSPDGDWVGFFADGKLKKIAVTGGLPVTLCDAPNARGGVWGPDNNILFTPTPNSSIERVSANGGTPAPVTKLGSPPELDRRSDRWPDILPDGEHALFNVVYPAGDPLSHADIAVVSVSTGRYRILVHGGSYPRYVPSGTIVYVVGTDLLAVPFNAATLRVTGPPVTLVSGVQTELNSGGAQFSFSMNGTMVYLPKSSHGPANGKLVWVNRKGEAETISNTARAYSCPRITQDAKKIVVEIAGQTPGIWIYDLARDTLGPLAVVGSDGLPTLTPNGQNVIYFSVRNGSAGLWMRRVDGSGGETNFTASTLFQGPDSVSPDGKLLAYTKGSATQRALMALSLEGEHNPRPLLPGPGNRIEAVFSPDGRWIAYVSDESGVNEVYVQSITGQGAKSQISSGGGSQPLWSRNGRELFYRAGGNMMAAEVNAGAAFSASKPRVLFKGDFESQIGPLPDASPNYDVSSDGQRFLMIQPEEPAKVAPATPGLHLVLNWFRDLPGAAQERR